MWRKTTVLAVALAGVSCHAASAADFTYQPWDQLLQQRVKAGRVDYQGLRADQAALDQWLATLSTVDLAQFGSDRQRHMAFWINAYNACVVRGVLDHYPLASVRDVKGFFDKITYRVAGQTLALNHIEAKARAFGDWRIHFAVVCASTSCPPIRAEAYVPERLDAQLSEQVRQFLRNQQQGLRLEGATLWASKIFDWYAGDFAFGQGGLFHKTTPAQLLAVLRPYLETVTADAWTGQAQSLRFFDYDWSLNQQAPPTP